MSVNLLWVSQYAPVSTIHAAGNRTLFYYFTKICNDPEINVRLVCFANKSLKDTTLEEHKNIECDFIVDPVSFFKRKIKRVMNIESSKNPFNRYFNMLSNYRVCALKETLKNIKKTDYRPDVVILDWTEMVFFAGYVKKLFPKTKIIASEVDVTYVGFERKKDYYNKGIKGFVWKSKYRREKKLELKSLFISDLILPQNPDNKVLLEHEGIPGNRIKWLIPFYEDFSKLSHKPINKDIVFYGAMPRPENYLSAIWFIDYVMPLLPDEDIRFVVVGNRPPVQLKERESKNVVITGFVDSVSPYFESSLCFAAPLVLGAGIKVKVLEALSSGIPVLTNNVGIEGISMVDGVDYYHCEKPEQYAEAIKFILKHGSDVGESAKQKIATNYSYKSCAQDYISWIKELSNVSEVKNG